MAEDEIQELIKLMLGTETLMFPPDTDPPAASVTPNFRHDEACSSNRPLANKLPHSNKLPRCAIAENLKPGTRLLGPYNATYVVNYDGRLVSVLSESRENREFYPIPGSTEVQRPNFTFGAARKPIPGAGKLHHKALFDDPANESILASRYHECDLMERLRKHRRSCSSRDSNFSNFTSDISTRRLSQSESSNLKD